MSRKVYQMKNLHDSPPSPILDKIFNICCFLGIIIGAVLVVTGVLLNL